jgi:Rad3-related DNA helicase
LGGGEEPLKLRLPSPFPPENLCLIIDDRVSTRYKVRDKSYDRVADSILSVAHGRKGNYMVFFPSYRYMDEVFQRFCQKDSSITAIVQKPGMTEEERDAFLATFSVNTDTTMVGFAVMGGIFGEGIDLPGDRMIGAVIVGVGLPQVCLERDIIRDYFQRAKCMGFEYAYIYPGMNRVLQAAGRVIRTEKDKGVVLLVDDRFSDSTYRRLFPGEWEPLRPGSLENMRDAINKFWFT